MVAQGKVGAPYNNQNRLGKGIKVKKRISVSMSISDHVEISADVFTDLRSRFEEYLLNCGVEPSEMEIKALARQWAYEAWWSQLRKAEDAQAMFL